MLWRDSRCSSSTASMSASDTRSPSTRALASGGKWAVADEAFGFIGQGLLIVPALLLERGYGLGHQVGGHRRGVYVGYVDIPLDGAGQLLQFIDTGSQRVRGHRW